MLLEAERRSFGLLSFGDIYQSFDAWGNMCARHARCALRVRAALR